MNALVEVGLVVAGAVAPLFKAICGGVAFLLVTWIGVLAADSWRVRNFNATHGVTGLGATAGGWNYLLQLPSVVILLTVAFGIGFYLVIRWSVRF